MKRTLIHIHRSIWIVAVVVLILFTLVITTARIVAPVLTAQRPFLERWASDFLKQPIQIGQLQVGWEKFSPVFKATQVDIFDDAKTHTLLKVAEMDVKVDLLGSLLNSHLQLGGLTISGATLTVQQLANDDFFLKGIGTFSPKGSGDSFDVFMDWLLQAPHLSLRNITLNWYDKNNKLLPIRALDLNLHNHNKKHNLWGEATLAQKIPTHLQFVVQLLGSWQQKDTLKARFYLRGQDVLLGQWLRDYPVAGLAIQRGLADFQVWGTWKDQKLQKIQSLISLRHGELVKDNVAEPFSIENVNSNIAWQLQDNSWNLDAQLQNLMYQRWQKIPGVAGMNIFIHATPQAGTMQLAGRNSKIDFGELFRAPLVLTNVQMTATWQQDQDGWYIEAPHLYAESVDADVNGSMSLLLPKDASSPMLSILASFHLLGAKHVANYLPIGVLSRGLVDWLETSIKDVDKVDSTLVLRGPIHNFPFDNNEGIFLIDSKVQNLNLAYWPQWPAAQQLSGQLIFRDRSMVMNIADGQINAVPLKGLQVTIPTMEKKVLAMLHIDGTTTADLANIFKFLQNSPLRTGTLSSVQDIQGKGTAQVELHLAIPLEHTDVKTSTDGKAKLQNAELTVHSLQLSKINGELTFSRDTFSTPQLTAVLWKKPINISIAAVDKKPQIKFQYTDLTGSLTPITNAWLMALQSQNFMGQITIPNDKEQAVQVNLQRLYIQPDSTQDLSKIKPSDIPRLDFYADDVRYGNKQFGKVELHVTPMGNGLQISNLSANSPTFKVMANGNWQLQNRQHVTQMAGDLTSGNLAAMLTSWGFPAAIKANQTHLHFNLSWPGPAYDPSIKTMSGSLDLGMQNGEIVNVGEAAEVKMDIGRLLSLLSIESLARRLRLGFSDLTARGLPFDKIQGNFQLVNGNAYTRNVMLTGPLANIGMAGRIGLGAEDYDLLLNVTPKISSSLPTLVSIATSPIVPVLGLAAGPVGPAIGAAAWVATKIVGGAVNKIATDTYHMSGPWADPKIVQTGNFWSPTKK